MVDRRRPLLGCARQGHRPPRLRRRRPRGRRLPGRPLRSLALLLAAALGAVLVWALLGKAIPALGPDDAGRVARLKGSIGYWNALALLADAALGLGLWLVASVRDRFGRPAGALLLYAATLVILLTQSRAGLLAGLAVVALALWLSESRVEAALLALLATGPADPRRRVGVHAARRSSRTAAPAPIASPTAPLLGVLRRRRRRGRRSRSSRCVPVERLVASRRREVVRGLVGAVALVAVVGARRARRSASATRSPGRPTRSAARARS